MSGYELSTDDLRDDYARDDPRYGELFDRWLKKHDADVIARYLRELAKKYGQFAKQAKADEMPHSHLVFSTAATLLAEEALHLTREKA